MALRNLVLPSVGLLAGLSLSIATLDCGGDAANQGGPEAEAPGAGATTSAGAGGSSTQGACASFYPDTIDGFYAAPDGMPNGDGSSANPWDLATALAQPTALAPGSTLWLRGGVYAGAFVSTLEGTAEAPITVRSYPGEWAIIDGGPSPDSTLALKGGATIFRDFEVMNSTTERYGGRADGITATGPGLKLINLLIHDTGNNGFWDSAHELELYGCLIYENGYDDSDRAHGHGVYTQNSVGRKHIVDNAIFNGYSFGIHAYTENGSIKGFDIIGNIWFNTGVAAAGVDTLKDNCLVGGLQPAAGILLQDNIGWARGPSTRSVKLGYSDPGNEDVALISNFFVGNTNFAEPWQSITMTGDTFFGTLDGVAPGDYPQNEYPTSEPAQPTVVIRPNQYEPGRAHIAVYNWQELEQVDVSLGDLLPVGMGYEIRNIQNYAAGAVVSGVYDGKAVSLPMAGLDPVQPIGSPDAIADSEKTGKSFNAFIVLPQRCLPK